MTESYYGEIQLFAFDFAPINWAFCWGQILPVQQNTPLFSLLGTTYGGNGQTTFGLPDFRGRVPVNQGAGPGLSPRIMGEQDGSEGVTLISPEMPSHTHSLNAYRQNTAAKRGATPSTGNGLSNTLVKPSFVAAPPIPSPTAMHPQTLGVTGGTTAHENRQPYLAVNFCICLSGEFPSFS